MKIYEEQNMHSIWNNTVTDYFTISNGVNRVAFCRQYYSVCTWTSSYHGSDILVWAVI